MVYPHSSIIPHATHLVAASPLALAPVGGATEVRTGTAEVASAAAEVVSTLLVDNRSAGLAIAGSALCGSRVRRGLLVVALSETSLATVSAVKVLVLKSVLRTAVTSGRAAAVEVAVSTGSRAGYTALGVAADIDDGDRGGEASSGRGSLLGCAGLHGRGGSRLANRAGAGEGTEAVGGIAVVLGNSAPSVLGAWSTVSITFLFLDE
jgi:hypothetical protein